MSEMIGPVDAAASLEQLETFINRRMHTPYDEAELKTNAYRLGEHLLPVVEAAGVLLPAEPDYTGVSEEEVSKSKQRMFNGRLRDLEIRRPCAYPIYNQPDHIMVQHILPLDGMALRVRFQTWPIDGNWRAGLPRVMDYGAQQYTPEESDIDRIADATDNSVVPVRQVREYYDADLMQFTHDRDGTTLYLPGPWPDTRTPQEKHVQMRQAARMVLTAFSVHLTAER